MNCAPEIHCIPHFMAFVMSNDLNRIKPYDDAIDNRVKVINYPKNFVNREPENKLELRMDENLPNEMKTEEFQYALVMLKRYSKFIFEENKIEPEFEDVNQGKIDWIGDKEEMGLHV